MQDIDVNMIKFNSKKNIIVISLSIGYAIINSNDNNIL